MAKDIYSIGVIGAGTMGSGIASISALSGYKTYVYDVNRHALTKAHAIIARGYDTLVEKNKIDVGIRKRSEASLYYISDIEEISECGLIIEAAVENIDLKKIIYGQLNEISRKDAILATNTSSISITAISAAVSKNKERVIGMHFFNPANKMKLVEIIKGEYTSDEVAAKAIEIVKKLGKVPVICKDTPAFIVNRVARSFYGEALKILGENNMNVKDIDTIMKEEGGFAMGPFELMDMIGIDVNYSVTKSVYESFFYDPKYKPHNIQQKMVEAGMLGKKTGRGFYQY